MTDRPLPQRILPKAALAAGCLLLASLALHARAQSPQTPPADRVRAAIQNELDDDMQLHLFAWKTRKNHGRDTLVERDVQTPSGVVSRVILINDQPLTPEQQRNEDERLRNMIDPEQMRQSLKEQKADDARTRKMLAAIPDAFAFVYVKSDSAPNGHTLTSSGSSPGAPSAAQSAPAGSHTRAPPPRSPQSSPRLRP
jgi:hypothetical protein